MADSRTPTAHRQQFSAVQFREVGDTEWNRIPGIGTWSEEQGETPTTDVNTTTGPASLPGTAPLPTFTLELPAAPLGHPAFLSLRDHRREGTLLQWQVLIQETLLAAGDATNTIDIAETTGVVTVNGTSPDFTGDQYDIGVALIVAGAAYVVDSISSTGVATVSPAPGTAIAASTSWRLAVPAIRYGPFTGTVVGGTALSGELGGAISSSLSIQMNTTPPNPTIVPSGQF